MKRIILVFILVFLAASARLEAHAFLKDAEPGVGSTVQTSPSEVRIRFTDNIEPAASSIQVFDASEKEVDKRDLHLDRADHALLHVSLPRLGAGIYKVVWRVVSVDTHVTSGSFAFRVSRQAQRIGEGMLTAQLIIAIEGSSICLLLRLVTARTALAGQCFSRLVYK